MAEPGTGEGDEAGGPDGTQDEAAAAVAARLEAGRWLFAQECRFLLGVADLAQLPPGDLPEVAFCGRSNVGKSSLVNALTGRKTLARTSNTPGRTQQINLFALGPTGDERLRLADLPGHGFARAPKDQVNAWTRLVNAYLRGRAPLRRVLLLVDARHGVKAVDREVMTLLDQAAVNYQVVLTKADKLGQKALAEIGPRVAAQVAGHVAAHPQVLLTSAETGQGIPEVRAALAELSAGGRDPEGGGD